MGLKWARTIDLDELSAVEELKLPGLAKLWSSGKTTGLQMRISNKIFDFATTFYRRGTLGNRFVIGRRSILRFGFGQIMLVIKRREKSGPERVLERIETDNAARDRERLAILGRWSDRRGRRSW